MNKYKSCNITKLVKVNLSNRNRNREGVLVFNTILFPKKEGLLKLMSYT